MNQTTDGKPCIDEVFSLYDRHGIPFEDIFSGLKDKKIVVNWQQFIKDCESAGWQLDKIKSKIRDAVFDTWGREWFEEWEKRFDFMIKHWDGCKNL